MFAYMVIVSKKFSQSNERESDRAMSLSLILKMIIHERTSISASSALWAQVIQVKLRSFFPRVAARYSSLVIPEKKKTCAYTVNKSHRTF